MTPFKKPSLLPYCHGPEISSTNYLVNLLVSRQINYSVINTSYFPLNKPWAKPRNTKVRSLPSSLSDSLTYHYTQGKGKKENHSCLYVVFDPLKIEQTKCVPVRDAASWLAACGYQYGNQVVLVPLEQTD